MTKTDTESELNQDVADAIEPYLSQEYNRSIGRKDWYDTKLKSVSVGEGHELYQSVLALYNKAYSLGLKDGARKWIKTKERLPEPNVHVLLTGNLLPTTIGYWIDKGEMSGCWQMFGGVSGLYFPDYWQPLPEPPTAEKEGK